MNAIELSSSISRFVEQIKPTNNPSDDAFVQGLPKWFIEDLENSATMLQEQAKEIEVLNQSYEILFKHRIEQEKKIEQLKTIIQAFKAGCGSKSSFAFGFEAPVCLEQYKSNQCMASDLNDAFVYMKGKING